MWRHTLLPGVCSAALACWLLTAGLALAEETAQCPRCEHRFVTRVAGRLSKGPTDKPCRVCRVQQAELTFDWYPLKLAKAGDEKERRHIRAEWKALGERYGDAFTTACLTNAHAGRVMQIDLLRGQRASATD